jgi:hypothetical protein
MAKSKKSRRPAGRNPVIAVRVSPPLHEKIEIEAKTNQRTMSETMADLLQAAIEQRHRFPGRLAEQAIEAATLAFVQTGDLYAWDRRITQPWELSLECRRLAVLSACTTLITQFVSTDAKEQVRTVEALRGYIANRPRSTEGGEK